MRVHANWPLDNTPQIGFEIKFISGWHGYFENPGDSGIPFIIDLQSEGQNLKINNIEYPLPHTYNMGPITNYVYHKGVFLPLSFDHDFGDTLNLTVSLEYLVCEESCVPQFIDLNFKLKKGQISPKWQALNEAYLFANSSVEGKFKISEGWVTLEYPSQDEALEVFPSVNIFSPNTALNTSSNDSMAYVQFAHNSQILSQTFYALIKNKLDVIKVNFEQGEIENTPQSFRRIETKNKNEDSQSSYLMILLMAFIGGLLLNVMPCIFPIISLKLIHLTQFAEDQERNSKLAPHMYICGVVTSFVGLALIIEILRTSGKQLGWGFQLQNTPFVACMAMLFYIIGLNLAGLFEINISISRSSKSHGLWGDFVTGILATLVATPCTAPFMATALGYAFFLEEQFQRLLLFVFLGVGMAFPIWIIEISSSVRTMVARFLPKPGPWMNSFRKILSYPMILTALWLLWVLVRQTDLVALFMMLILFVSMTATLQLYQASFSWNINFRRLIIILIASQFALIATFLSDGFNINSQHEFKYEKFELAKLNFLLEQNERVFVIATADWCVSCKFNERLVLKTSKMEKFYKEQGIRVLVADWTSKDTEITEYLSSFNRAGVPLYVFYQNESNIVLPQILSFGIVSDALRR